MTNTRVQPEKLRVRIDPDRLATADLMAGGRTDHHPTSQQRAEDAIDFWATVRGKGFNLFACGLPGVGRRSAIRTTLERIIDDAPPFDDWVYVNNFVDEHHPKALRLPFGVALPFRKAMNELIEDLVSAIPSAFEAEDYKLHRNAIEAEQQTLQEEKLAALREQAAEQNTALVRTPMGFVFVPKEDGEIVKPEIYNEWPAERRAKLEEAVGELQEQLSSILEDEIPAIERETRQQIRTLDRETATSTIRLAVAHVADKLSTIEPIREYLAEVTEDLISHFHLFLMLAQSDVEIPVATKLEHPMLRRYAVNVMDAVSPDGSAGAASERGVPVIEESDPSYSNLIGRIEHQPKEGALITDFTMIKPGALHRANGGYLILDARDVLMQPFAWEALKRALKTSSIRVTSAAERLSLISTISLEPDEIPLSVKVALIGDRQLYYLLSMLDPDFPSLFKVQADFEDDSDLTDDALNQMAHALIDRARESELTPFARSGLAAVLEEATRISDDAQKLSLRVEAISDLMVEADHWARTDCSDEVTDVHVAQAVSERHRRRDRLRLRSIEMIEREIVGIDVDGAQIGQVNALSVISIGDMRFGRPTRITARTRMGTGKIIDIEREVKLGGPLHSKGVLILSSFLTTRYGVEQPVSLSASLVFEQSYGGVDGDSASSTELYALLSALADVPIKQSFAVTGSVDQFGRVQAIGGVNEKIEGFFDVCARKGLTGEQGVLIPDSNVQHLNLRQDVVDAVEAGRFAIHAVDHIDTGIELLTGCAAGERNADGAYPPDSINGRVMERLAGYGKAMRRLMKDRAASEDDEDGTA